MANAVKDNKCFHDVAQYRESLTFASVGHGETATDFVYFDREKEDVIPTAFACVASLHPNVIDGIECLIDVKCVCVDNIGSNPLETIIFLYVTNNSDTYDATDVVINVAAI